jgi:alpha-D-ribose 1-methylphosphonate 5-triphosphate diphosphatase PhnM
MLPHHHGTSNVSSEIARNFLSAVKAESMGVAKANFADLSTLCDERGFNLASR